MASGNMSPSEVKSVVSALDASCPVTNEKAVMKGTRLGQKSGASGKESGFKEGKVKSK